MAPPTWRVHAVILVAVAAGCRGDSRAKPAHRPDSAVVGARMSTTDSIALARDAWSVPEVLRRLREAGLVVTDSGESAHRSELHVPGHLLHLGRGTLAVYLYSGRAARARDLAGLDTTLHGLPTIDTPHYIVSGNLIAILQTPKDETVERVTNALTARHTVGPP